MSYFILITWCLPKGTLTHNLQEVTVFVKTDTGGGGPLNVQRVVKDLIKAGASGVFLEVKKMSVMHSEAY